MLLENSAGMRLIERRMNALAMTSPLSKKSLISFPEAQKKNVRTRTPFASNVIKLPHNLMHGILFFFFFYQFLLINLQELERFCPVDVSFKLNKHVGLKVF